MNQEGRELVLIESIATKTGTHTCHWTGCDKAVPPAMWGCKTHWFSLPQHIRSQIWLTYKPGQEISKTPSREYLEAAKAAEEWIRENHP